MKTSLALLLPLIGIVQGFTTPKPATPSLALQMVWGPFKNAEMPQAEKKTSKKHFQSRSLVDYQKDLEAGKVRHLFPVMNAKERIKKGELRPSDVPVSIQICVVVCT